MADDTLVLDLNQVFPKTATVRLAGTAYDMDLELPLRRANRYAALMKRMAELEGAEETSEEDEQEYDQRSRELIGVLLPQMPDDVRDGLSGADMNEIHALFLQVAMSRQGKWQATATQTRDRLARLRSAPASNGHTAARRKRG